jgi:hypothetical protein
VSGLRARTGLHTLLGLLAALGLVAAMTMPVLANHDPANGPEVMPTSEEFPGGEPACETGVAIRFNNPAADDSADVDLSEEVTATVTILSVADNKLTFEVENGLAAVVKVKGGVSSPGTDDQNVYDYSGLPGGGIAHDDGLTNPNSQGISHVDFCLVIAEEEEEEELSASLTIIKDADGDAGTEFAFGEESLADGEEFTLTFETGDFVDGMVQATVSETLTADQIADLWELESIDCNDGATFEVDGNSVTVTLADGDTDACTFVNVQGDEGTLGGNPTPSPSDDELPDTAATGSSDPLSATALSLILVAALGTMFAVRIARQR